MIRAIGFVFYSVFAVLAFKRMVRNIRQFRSNYISKRTCSPHVVKVHVRLLVTVARTAYILSERTILIQAFPKIANFNIVIDDEFRKKTSRFVLEKLCRIYNVRFGDHYEFRCYISAYTRKCEDDTAVIATALKAMHHTKEAFLLKYPKYRADIERIVDWFEHESLSDPVTMEKMP
jgi:hypothetical protein